MASDRKKVRLSMVSIVYVVGSINICSYLSIEFIDEVFFLTIAS